MLTHFAVACATNSYSWRQETRPCSVLRTISEWSLIKRRAFLVNYQFNYLTSQKDFSAYLLLPRRVESTIMHLEICVTLCDSVHTDERIHEPLIWVKNIEYLKIQPPQTESPLAAVAIRALEISTPGFPFRWNVPAATSLICNQGETIGIRDCTNKLCIFADRPETVANIQSRASKLCESWRKVCW